MGGALISGMLNAGFVMPGEVLLYDIDDELADTMSRKLGAIRCEKIEELAKKSQIIIIAVKPVNIDDVFKTAATEMDKADKVVVSIASGIRIEAIRNTVRNARVVRVMPNTPALIGEGASGMVFDGQFEESEKKTIVKLFESCGLVEIVKSEDLIDVVTGLSGSGPAYVFAFINSLADGGVLEGLPRTTALKLAIKTVIGAAKLAESSLEDDIHLEALKDRVASPGGTTARGLYALEKGAFRATVIDAVREGTKRAREIGEK
jgi:pyrroline-5-carboxylate reductase